MCSLHTRYATTTRETESMGKIADAVTSTKYREALIAQALKCANQLDNLEDEKNLAPISRELRLILVALGIDEAADAGDVIMKLQEAVTGKTAKD
jgi:hypothetical protein